MRNLLACILLIFFSVSMRATHNIGGTISYKHVFGYTYEITVTTTTKYSGPAMNADRCLHTVYISDPSGTILDSVNCPRVNGPASSSCAPGTDGEIITLNGQQYKKNIYTGLYAFMPGNFILTMTDVNLTGGIINITGDSSQQPLVLKAEIVINQFINCPVNSAVCGNLSIGFASLHSDFSYSSFTSDIDGDSLWFELATPLGQFAQDIPGYIAAASYGITIDPQTGLIHWPNPSAMGQYLFNVKISQYRNGYYVGYVMHTISVECNNNGSFTGAFQNGTGNWTSAGSSTTPALHTIPGTALNFTINYTCPGISGANLSGISGGTPAGTNIQASVSGNTLTFNGNGWIPNVSDAREQPYLFSFQASNSISSSSFSQAYMVLVFVDGAAAPLCPAISLGEKEESRSFTVFPSPAKDHIECRFSGNTAYDQLLLINSLGQTVSEKNVSSVSETISFETTDIAGGIYYLLVKKNQTIIHRKKIVIEP